ncbi:MAG: MFS transporter [Stappia sp.]|uniref:MFS transporter n=1 Tax=Stappia sp. TaxID=1870903 RepID=UPI000C68A745|nr:MFS transporter [Stappia sp.]MAA97497.1 MFS transporter [Stappia sp.]MBM22030.1 MFS transporter [Stappia sp.]
MTQGHLVASLFAAYFFGFGLFLPFFPVVLRDSGLSPGEIGTLLSLPMLVRLAANPLVGALADRFATPRVAVSVLSALSAALFLAFFLASAFWAYAVLLVAVALVWSPLIPIEDAVAARLDREGKGQYGRMRLWGSISFIAANLVGGTAAASAHAAPAVIGGIAAGLVVSALVGLKLTVPSAREAERGPDDEQRVEGRAKSGMGFLLVVVGAGILQGSHGAYYGFSALFWEAEGFGGLAIGILWGLGVTTEIVLFAFAGSVGARIGSLGILGVGAGAAILRWVLFAQVSGPLATGSLQLLHGLSFGATHLGAVAYVAARAPRRWAGFSQGLLSMVFGFFTALASALAGLLYQSGPSLAFQAMAAMAALGTLLLAAGALFPGERRRAPAA